ncbi:MAG: bifunctional phosphopantothenoylcysteine decarboxylase/phosphopantothenate--cysteine ligase CoaBC [Rhodobacteraceae bacterium]|nr:bifunctional phosphopantothenoylcysteine decarboxylase/phosphopantothenate--cysteine ligase CoaBC [Paracoccaceae bacterium]
MLVEKRVLLIIGGGIAAYKTLELIRLLRGQGAAVTPVMTKAASEFVTPLSVSALAGEKVYTHLFDLTDEAEMGHINLSRVADLIVVAPATADLIARMATGRADDLASTLLLATDTPVLLAPAMNVRMWQHPATQRNLAQIQADGACLVGPDEGEMACGEYGLGRFAEPAAILFAIDAMLSGGPLLGKHVIVTSGPTHEIIDPVRYIANRSSGAQGAAIAVALRDLGASVSFVTGPAAVPPPVGVTVIRVETAAEMAAAVTAALPADAAVMAAAVADWRVANVSDRKMKKDGTGKVPALKFVENPDILRDISASTQRPKLVVGFAAETDDVLVNAQAKLARKGCDWIVANDVSPASGIMGGMENAVTILSGSGVEVWPRLSKVEVARRLASRIVEALV